MTERAPCLPQATTVSTTTQRSHRQDEVGAAGVSHREARGIEYLGETVTERVKKTTIKSSSSLRRFKTWLASMEVTLDS